MEYIHLFHGWWDGVAKIDAKVQIIQAAVEEFKRTGVFKLPKEDDEIQSENEGRTTDSPARRESDESTPEVVIKKEKDDDKENIESAGAMPPPAKPMRGRPKKVKNEPPPKLRSTRSRALNVKVEQRSSEIRPSDVILQKEDIPVIDILDSSDDHSRESSSSTRSTRTKKKKTKTSDERKRDHSNSSEDAIRSSEAKSSKRTKRKKVNEEEAAPQPEEPKDKHTDGSIYEDARSTIGSTKSALNKNVNTMDATFVLSQPVHEMNATVIIDKNKKLMNETTTLIKPTIPAMNETVVISKKLTDMNIDDIMTEDESISPKETLKPSSVLMKPSSSKQIFNPYDNSPVKKRVEAFERIASEQESTRVTRSKKGSKKVQDNGKQSVSKFQGTPLKTSRIPTSVQSCSKIGSGTITPLKTSIILSEKSKSALKLSQEEFTERELKRKMEAEEKRRKREEKHIKAQKIREEEEKKKQKLLEERLLKEQEKISKMLAEREEKARKKAESERKRLLAAQERKKEEEKKRIEEEKAGSSKIDQSKKPEPSKQKPMPIFMKHRAPLLPTEDCYDSDDEQNNPRRLEIPWERKGNFNAMLTYAKYGGDKVKHTLFCTKATTPNLTDIFQNIDPKKLKRTSSAIWRKTPRFTLLPISEQSIYEALHGD